MGMGPAQAGGGDEDGFDAAPMSEINVTPMVDVMLVLLIIFMVAEDGRRQDLRVEEARGGVGRQGRPGLPRQGAPAG
jgi:biopolymer transport protein ExbD